MDLIKTFEAYNDKHQLIPEGAKVLVAVSGGVDSMVLLHLLRRSGVNVGVAHCNYQLRGEDSNLDEALVRTFCVEANVPFHSKQFNTKEISDASPSSLQMVARDLRYQFFDSCMDEGYDLVATAHTLNDNLETVLMRLATGAGLEGLSGIPVKNETIVRPLLFAPKGVIYDYAQQLEVPFREDASNQSDDYDRNFIRNNIVPHLEELNPNLYNAVANSINYIGEAKEIVDEELDAIRELLEDRGDKMYISIDMISNHVAPVTLMYSIVKDFGFNSEQAEQILASVSSQPGKHFNSVEYKITRDREHWILEPIKTHEAVNVTVDSEEDLRELTNYLQVEVGLPADMEISDNNNEAYLDLDKLQFPISLRYWEEGDRMQPLGMEGSKKISDILIDDKIPQPEKESQLVFTDNDGIQWLVGRRSADGCKIDDSTRRVLKLSLTD